MAILATMIALVVPNAEHPIVRPEGEQANAVRKVSCNHWCHKRWRIVRPYNSKLERIAGCESSHRWHIATGNGFYGGLQFTLGTWHSVGGQGYPHWFSRLEQKYRAVKVYLRRGNWADWPVCGYR